MNADDLKSQVWRMRNLYYCRDEETGQKLKFEMRAEQEELLRHFITMPGVPAYVVKSRRLGISTFVDTFMADTAAFSKGFTGVIIDQKQDDATKKMVNIVRFALDNLPGVLRGTFEPGLKRNDSELRLRLRGDKESEESSIHAITGSRGDTCHMLHISEWGPIAAMDPTRSKEIRTGALPSARKGRRVVETTWAGGKGGDLWDLVKPIMERDPNAEGVLYFFPWHADPQAVKLDGFVGDDAETYFKDLGDKLGKTFSQEQKKWYVAKKLEQGIFVKREYPSTLDEAFSAPVEGSVYGDVLMEIRGKGRIIPFEWNRDWPVFVYWDIGWTDAMAVWFVQQVGLDFHWIHWIEATQHTAADMMSKIRDTQIPLAGHFIPHDAAQKKPGDGLNFRDNLIAAGATNVVTLLKCKTEWDGNNRLRSIIQRSFFRVPQCEGGLVRLEAYHVPVAKSGGAVKENPVHDWSSHTAAAARYVAEADAAGLVRTASAKAHRNVNPRAPDGAVIDIGGAGDRPRRQPGTLARSGHTPFQ